MHCACLITLRTLCTGNCGAISDDAASFNPSIALILLQSNRLLYIAHTAMHISTTLWQDSFGQCIRIVVYSNRAVGVSVRRGVCVSKAQKLGSEVG